MQASQFLGRHVLGDAGDTRRSSLHMLQRVYHHAVVGAVAGGLDDYEPPEAELVDENFLLLPPGGRERFVLRLG